jgi:hypothetical protein
MVAESRSQVGFSQSDAAKENHITFLLDEAESEQVFYLKLIDFLRPGPLELLKGFDLRKTCGIGVGPRRTFEN